MRKPKQSFKLHIGSQREIRGGNERPKHELKKEKTNLYNILFRLKVRLDGELAVGHSGHGYGQAPVGQVVCVGRKMLV